MDLLEYQTEVCQDARLRFWTLIALAMRHPARVGIDRYLEEIGVSRIGQIDRCGSSELASVRHTERNLISSFATEVGPTSVSLEVRELASVDATERS
jgi:hypothetical protein